MLGERKPNGIKTTSVSLNSAKRNCLSVSVALTHSNTDTAFAVVITAAQTR